MNAATGAGIAVPAGVNTNDDELHPALSADGRSLVFTRMKLQPKLNGDVVPPTPRSHASGWTCRRGRQRRSSSAGTGAVYSWKTTTTTNLARGIVPVETLQSCRSAPRRAPRPWRTRRSTAPTQYTAQRTEIFARVVPSPARRAARGVDRATSSREQSSRGRLRAMLRLRATARYLIARESRCDQRRARAGHGAAVAVRSRGRASDQHVRRRSRCSTFGSTTECRRGIRCRAAATATWRSTSATGDRRRHPIDHVPRARPRPTVAPAPITTNEPGADAGVVARQHEARVRAPRPTVDASSASTTHAGHAGDGESAGRTRRGRADAADARSSRTCTAGLRSPTGRRRRRRSRSAARRA